MMLKSRTTPSVRSPDYGRGHGHAQIPKMAHGKNSMNEDDMIANMAAPTIRNQYTPNKSSLPVYDAVMDIMKDGRERTIGDLLLGVQIHGLDTERQSLEFMVKRLVENGDLLQEKLPDRMFGYRVRRDLLSGHA